MENKFLDSFSLLRCFFPSDFFVRQFFKDFRKWPTSGIRVYFGTDNLAWCAALTTSIHTAWGIRYLHGKSSVRNVKLDDALQCGQRQVSTRIDKWPAGFWRNKCSSTRLAEQRWRHFSVISDWPSPFFGFVFGFLTLFIIPLWLFSVWRTSESRCTCHLEVLRKVISVTLGSGLRFIVESRLTETGLWQ